MQLETRAKTQKISECGCVCPAFVERRIRAADPGSNGQWTPSNSDSRGGTPEAVGNGKTGLLVEPGNASAMAEAILGLLSDDELRKSMGKAGRERAVELFSWNQIAENLLSKYEDICDSHN